MKTTKELISKKTVNDFQTPFPSIKVHVRLLGKQETDVNKWNCTIKGEKRVVTAQNVEWYCVTPDDAIHSFEENEVESFTITGEIPDFGFILTH